MAEEHANSDTLEKEIDDCKLLVDVSQSGDVETLRRLLEAGVSVNAYAYNRSLFYKSQDYLTPLQYAALHGNDNCVQLLIEAEADLDATDRFDVTAVHLAAEKGHLRSLQLLLDAGASCTTYTKYSKHGSYTVPYLGGTTALHLATENNHPGCVRELILNGADYNATDELGRTSLYIAAEKNFETCLLTHLDNAVGRDILSLPVKETGNTPLHECVRLTMMQSIRRLLAHGSDVNHRNHAGYSPLHFAVQNRNKFSFRIVRELIRNGFNADVNLCDGNGWSNLHYVCFNNNGKSERRPELAAFLIAYGAKFEDLKNKHGLTLLQQELRTPLVDDVILKAMVCCMAKLPSLQMLGILKSRGSCQRMARCVWYQQLCSTPRTLQHYCRCVIRQALGIKRLKLIWELPLPRPIMEYLLLECDQYKNDLNVECDEIL